MPEATLKQSRNVIVRITKRNDNAWAKKLVVSLHITLLHIVYVCECTLVNSMNLPLVLIQIHTHIHIHARTKTPYIWYELKRSTFMYWFGSSWNDLIWYCTCACVCVFFCYALYVYVRTYVHTFVRTYACIYHICFRYSKCQVRNIVNFLTHNIIYKDTQFSAGKVTRKVNQPTKKRNRHEFCDGIAKKITNIFAFLTRDS